MTGASIHSPDRTSVSPEADVCATAAVSPAEAVATNSNPTSTGVASATSAASSLSPPVPQVGLGAADFSGSAELLECDEQQASEQHAEACHGDCKVAFGSFGLISHDTPINSAPPLVADELIKAFGISHELSACHFGIPSASSIANSVVAKHGRGTPALGGASSLDSPAVSSGIAGLSPRVSIKNAIAFLVAVASEIISKSASTTSIPTS